MSQSFNLFRLNCMMEDNKSKNYNSVIVSLVCELLYENNNIEITKTQCFNHITKNLKINIEPDLFTSILEKNQSFLLHSDPYDITIKLKSEKYSEINRKVLDHSIEHYIEIFVLKRAYDSSIKTSIENLLFQSIYENINSFTINNVKSILPENLKNKFSRNEIEAFNEFLDEKNQQKDIVLFNVFLKAVEFAIITSGKGVKQFTKDIFTGKDYCLDTNIIFRLLGVNGLERQESITKLLESCIHQGIKFKYSNETYKEVKRKIESSLLDIQKGVENKSIDILQDLISEDGIEFNNGFITHFASCKLEKSIKNAEQYQLKLLSDLRSLCTKYDIGTIDDNLNRKQVEYLANILYDKKKELNGYNRYTKTASKVDAINILLVRKLRGNNNYNYSDIKSFYLTTDKTLNSILAKSDSEKIAETILPSQLYILHNALSNDEDQEKDYQAFNKFLKRRTTEFKYEGKDVLNFIDEIRNITTDTYEIRDVIRAYSDKKYERNSSLTDSEPEFKSMQEFAETYFDRILNSAKTGDKKYKENLQDALSELPRYIKTAKNITRIIDIFFSILIIPIAVIITKAITKNLTYIISATVVIESFKFLISTKTNLLSNLCKEIYNWKVQNSSFNKITKGQEKLFTDCANEQLSKDIKVWK